MKLTRSLINQSIDRARAVLEHFGIALPPYAYWSPQQWTEMGDDVEEIRQCMLGWDVTDFGSDDFHRYGRTLFTLRNGVAGDSHFHKPYAEKLILDPEGQRAPAHYHENKMEDLINRFGGNLIAVMHTVNNDGGPSDEPVSVQVNGQSIQVEAGEEIRLHPGESLCIPPRTIHQFWGEPGTGFQVDGIGYTVSGEVSSVCDDHNDNFFMEPMRRFPQIVEDEPARYVLCHEYPPASQPAAAGSVRSAMS